MASVYVLLDPFFRSLTSGASVIGFVNGRLTTALNKHTTTHKYSTTVAGNGETLLPSYHIAETEHYSQNPDILRVMGKYEGLGNNLPSMEEFILISSYHHQKYNLH